MSRDNIHDIKSYSQGFMARPGGLGAMIEIFRALLRRKVWSEELPVRPAQFQLTGRTDRCH